MGCRRPRRVRGVIAYSALTLRPLGDEAPPEHRVWRRHRRPRRLARRSPSPRRRSPNVIGALIGGTVGLLLARLIGDAHFWANADNLGVIFLHTLILLALPYIGLVLGAKVGRVARTRAARGAVPAHAQTAAALQNSRHQRHHRRPHRRHLRDRISSTARSSCRSSCSRSCSRWPTRPIRCAATAAAAASTSCSASRRWPASTSSSPTPIFPSVKEVDLKLIELARSLQGKIVTNDFNLNKVAQLRGVEVLNINELANSLKPVVLPGETMKVFILKEGKEYNQGVAYLDDGTMVVVDNARPMIGKTIDVVVTSVLQTTAGKMIFGRFIDANAQPTPIDREATSKAVARLGDMKQSPPFHWCGPSSSSFPPFRFTPSCSARCRFSPRSSTAKGMRRTGARAHGRG